MPWHRPKVWNDATSVARIVKIDALSGAPKKRRRNRSIQAIAPGVPNYGIAGRKFTAEKRSAHGDKSAFRLSRHGDGQTATMSALADLPASARDVRFTPKADMDQRALNVRFVPTTTVGATG